MRREKLIVAFVVLGPLMLLYLFDTIQFGSKPIPVFLVTGLAALTILQVVGAAYILRRQVGRRRTLKVCVLGLSTFVLLTWEFSTMFGCWVRTASVSVGLRRGVAYVGVGNASTVQFDAGMRVLGRRPWWGHSTWPGIDWSFSMGTRSVRLPLWMAYLPTVALAVFVFFRHRWFPGECHVCAYDLTGNQSGICPECGTAVEW